MEMFNPPHPGAVLKDALEGNSMKIGAFAAHLGVSRNTVSRILNEKAAITPDLSIRIAEAFGQKQTDFWFRLQGKYDFWQAKQAKRKKIHMFKFDKAA